MFDLSGGKCVCRFKNNENVMYPPIERAKTKKIGFESKRKKNNVERKQQQLSTHTMYSWECAAVTSFLGKGIFRYFSSVLCSKMPTFGCRLVFSRHKHITSINLNSSLVLCAWLSFSFSHRLWCNGWCANISLACSSVAACLPEQYCSF